VHLTDIPRISGLLWARIARPDVLGNGRSRIACAATAKTPLGSPTALSYIIGAMNIELSEEETTALTQELHAIVQNDR
jgi:hypothetical protein